MRASVCVGPADTETTSLSEGNSSWAGTLTLSVDPTPSCPSCELPPFHTRTHKGHIKAEEVSARKWRRKQKGQVREAITCHQRPFGHHCSCSAHNSGCLSIFDAQASAYSSHQEVSKTVQVRFEQRKKERKEENEKKKVVGLPHPPQNLPRPSMI